METLKKPKAILSLLIIAVCFIYIFNVFDFNKVALILSDANSTIFIISSIITIKAFWLVRTLRWLVLLKALGYRNIPLTTLYFATSNSLALSVVTPVQSGELLKVEILKKHFPELSRTDGYLSLMVERVFDLFFVTLIAASSLTINPLEIPSNILLIFCFSFLVIALALILFRKKIPNYSVTYTEIKTKFSFALKRPVVLFMLCFYTLIAWTSIIIGWWCALFSIEIFIDALNIISLTTGMTLINVISLIPGAVGVSEVGIAVWLEFLGIDADQSAAGSFIIRLYGLMSVILGFTSLIMLGIGKNLKKHLIN